jgi:hypothetical protein
VVVGRVLAWWECVWGLRDGPGPGGRVCVYLVCVCLLCGTVYFDIIAVPGTLMRV